MSKKEKIYFALQKIVGVSVGIIAVCIAFITGEGTASLCLAAMGTYLVCTSSMILDNGLKQDIEDEKKSKKKDEGA